MSSRVRVATRTSSPSRCTWIRMPSSLTSTETGAAAGPVALVSAAARSGALEASMGSTGRPTSRPNPVSASAPPVIAATVTRTVEPASIAARRTDVSGTPAAWATASCTSASRAPWRTAPVTTPRSQACSGGGGPAEQLGDRGRPCGLGAGAGERGDRLERLVHLQHRQRGGVGRLGEPAEASPAEPGAALPQRAAEVGGDGLDLLGRGRGQQCGDGGDLGLAGPGRRHGVRGGDEVGEQHPAIVTGTADMGERSDTVPG